jgi:formylglycine-generating enzyme required for sulfatase activity|tara:strand:+ start:154 stop:735 length:582 start_codon:yes stop_codon:yes gene_type:complete
MTNTKQLTSAVALLACIALLDNYIFVELEPGFESMVLIEPYGSANEAETTQAKQSGEALSEAKDFWIDQHRVSSADFARFLESTGYEPQGIAPHSQQILTSQIEEVALAVSAEKLRLPPPIGNANWKKASDNFPINYTVMGQDDLKVHFNDAQTYCNWLGKVLPTAEQFEHTSMLDHNQKVAELIEFRCVRNI